MHDRKELLLFQKVIRSFQWSVVMCVIEAYFVQSQPVIILMQNAEIRVAESQLVPNSPITKGDDSIDLPTEVVSRQLDYWHTKVN